MARKIKIQFNDRDYFIEYNRESIVKLMSSLQKHKDGLEQAIDLIYYGLLKNHANEMPERDLIIGWAIAMGDQLKPFAEAVKDLVQDVVTIIQSEQKQGNLKWEVVD